MELQDMLNDITIWNKSRTEICQNLSSNFDFIYKDLTHEIDTFCEEHEVNLSDHADLAQLMAGIIIPTLSTVNDKDVIYWAVVAVLYDYVDLSIMF